MRKHFTALVVSSSAAGLLAAAPAVAAAQPAPNQVIVADQGNGDHVRGQRVSVLDQNADWNSPSAEAWHWVPPATSGWRGLTDAKVRTKRGGRKVVLVTAGAGRVAKIDWNTRKTIWTSSVPAGDNAHSIELLPGGQIVVAGSGGYLRFFPAGAANNSKPTSFKRLPGAHGVLYNDNRLWALGYGELRQYDIRRNSLADAGPTIRRVGNGHDLSLVHGTAKHEMWLTNTNNVYTYDKYSGQRPQRVTGPHGGRKVKSVGNQRDGTILQTRPHDTNRGQCPRDFQTPTVNLFDADGSNPRSKTKRGSCFYKARPVIWTYY